MKNKVMDMPKSTKLALGIVVVVVLVALIVKGAIHKKAPITEVPPVPQEEVVSAPKPPRKTTTVTKTPEPSPEMRAYTELILSYKNRTLQFGPSCQVTTSAQVYKVGSELLLDNRTEVPVSISVGLSVITLPSYGYAIMSLPGEGVFMVGCNDHKNVATITVQK